MDIKSLVRDAELHANQCDGYEAFEWCDSTAKTLEIQASGGLYWFALVPADREDSGWLTCSKNSSTAAELLHFANTTFGCFGDSRSAPEVASILAAAKIEFARDCLCNVLMAADTLQRKEESEELKYEASCLVNWALTLDWENADVIAANPPENLRESVACSFAMWCDSGFKALGALRRNSIPEFLKHQLIAAIALVWVDVAVSNARRRLTLLSEAAEAIGFCAHLQGMAWVIRSQKASAAKYGKRGAEIRHQKAASLKAWAVEESRKMPGSPIGVARRLLGRLPADLQDVSLDPLRMLYNALRAHRMPPYE